MKIWCMQKAQKLYESHESAKYLENTRSIKEQSDALVADVLLV